jgi:3-phenylpropionate/trans-cinnamate dioxygenase ferredoxin reductase subunit
MAERKTYVIVGAGMAGAKSAEALREEGFDGRIVLIGEEQERPYERPPLSKDFLRGETDRDRLYVHADSFYAEQEIELRPGTRVQAVDVETREVVLGGCERLRFDRLLLTTGAEPRRLVVDGVGLDGVHYLREIADAEALKAAFARSRRLVVVGGGWIGAEVAASARQLGLEVAMVEPGEAILERALGRELGGFYGELHRANGVDLRTGAMPTRFEGHDRVSAVRLQDGGRLECDLVLVGIGVVPRTALAEAAGILVENGVIATRRLETSVPGVFVAGDLASAQHPFYNRRVRVEHWANALNQPAVVAKSMLGKQAAYDRLPYFFSDQYDVGMEFVGDPSGSDEVVIRGDVSEREFIAFWLSHGRVVAGMNVNVWDVVDDVKALISSRVPVDPNSLRDPDASLGDLNGAGLSRPPA